MPVAKMSSEIIRELFRSLENTMRQRMDVIEEIVRNSSPKTAPAADVRNTYLSLEKNILNLTEQLAKLSIAFQRSDELIHQGYTELYTRIDALSSDVSALKAARAGVQEDIPIEAIEAEVEAEVAEAEALETPDESVEEEVEEEEEEVEELELEEFTFKGTTYYRDGDNNVYRADEEGGIMDEPIGRWDSGKNRILRA